MRIARLIIGVALAAGVAACGKAIDENESAGFRPPASQRRADFEASLERRFNRMDRNTDGAIEMSEVRRRPERIRMLDADGDGEVTRGEFTSQSLARFDRADVNRDGTLTAQEREASGLFAGGGDRKRDSATPPR